MDTHTIIAEAIALFLIGASTLPSFNTIVRTPHRKKGASTWGDNKDGNTTPESEDAFSARTPKLCICFSLISGVLVFVLRTFLDRDNYFVEQVVTNALGWVFATCYTKDSIVCFRQGIYIAISCAILICMVMFQDMNSFKNSIELSPVFSTIQMAILFLIGIASLSIPRRPRVFHDGGAVVEEFNRSFLSRWTFTCLGDLLKLARKKNDLSVEDLPKMNSRTRAKELSQEWRCKFDTSHGKLWVKLWGNYKWQLTLQMFLGVTQSSFMLGPQIAIFHILTLIEIGGNGRDFAFWVLTFGITTVASNWIEVGQDLVSWTLVANPMRAQLMALIFEKVMRRKDTKNASASSQDNDSTDGPELEKSTQRILNLIGIDATRISDCARDLFRFFHAPSRLLIAGVFLCTILSWKGVVLGLCYILIVSPVTRHYCNKCLKAQTALLNTRDIKAGTLSEVLHGSRQIKFSGLEDRWERLILAQRDIELGRLWDFMFYKILLTGQWVINPIIVSVIAFGTHAYVCKDLAASQAFTALGIFTQLDIAMMTIPELLNEVIIAHVSLQRVEQFLEGSSLGDVLTRPKETPGQINPSVIRFDNASLSWSSDEKSDEDNGNRFTLKDINISFPSKQLSVICGRTGSGKSLLLNSILGEAELLSGSIVVPKAPSERYDSRATKEDWIIPNSIAFVAQIPWIENGTVEENIRFGLPMDRERFQKVINACAMTKDIEMLADGDQTEIGMGGINLSGGQRWRLTLARALYSRAGIILLDDIFSAVDVHVGQLILNNALVGELSAGRTCILATHHLSLCKAHVKSIIELENGTAKQFSSVQELEEFLGAPYELIDDTITSPVVIESNGVNNISIDSVADQPSPVKQTVPQKFVEDEFRKKGNVGSSVYMELLKACGGWLPGTWFLMSFALCYGLNIARSYWLRIWTNSDNGNPDKEFAQQQIYMAPATQSTSPNAGIAFYLGIYFAFCVAVSVVRIFSYAYTFKLSLQSSKTLFRRMLFNVLRAPSRWMDTVPIGRIMNRFTTDFGVMDWDLMNGVFWGTGDFFRLLGVMATGAFLSPYIILMTLAVSAVSSYLAVYVITASRAVRRLESTCRSVVFEQFRVVLVGIVTIRAFEKTEIFLDRVYRKIDDLSSASWHSLLCHCWLIWRVNMIGAVYLTIIAAIVSMTLSDPGLAGFVLAVSLELGSALFWTLYHASALELRMNSTERVMEYANMPTETMAGKEPPASWPTAGCLNVKDLVVAYNHDLAPVLKGVNFNISSQERVGIVGRTGSGKSTLTLSLFRFIEAREGSIIIDGQDISQLKLQSLRRNLAIIPQDPVLFSGTLRSNLDFDNEYDDTVLFDALRRVQLINFDSTTTPSDTSSSTSSSSNQNIFLSLKSPISEGGLNLSQGQRQLLCLARAIIRRPKILILDEATSSVDRDTDFLIQKSIREDFVDSTLLVIAHRLSTVGDFDKIMVMHDGKVKEFGAPRDLIEKKGVFWGMVKESGEKDKLIEMSGL